MYRILSVVTFSIFIGGFVMGQQDVKLAQYYFKNGEYEKSAQIYKKLSEQSGFNEYFFNMYMESLIAIEEYQEAEDVTKEMLLKRPDQVQLYVTYGNLLERQAQTDNANEQYKLAVDIMPANQGLINSLGNSFMRLTKYDLALEVFLKGEKLMGNQGLFSYNLSEVYRRLNDTENMIHHYLKSPMATTNRISSVQNYFSRYLQSEEDYETLRKKLYENAQTDADNVFFPEMIQWVFIKRKDYSKALRQARALDRRLEENGSRLYTIAKIASNDRDYDTSIKAYEYILESKEPNSAYYVDAKKELLASKRKKLIYSNDYTKEDLAILKDEYLKFLVEMGRGKRTALIVLELAELEALYLNDLHGAITTLDGLITLPGINNYIRANAKLDLGDYYLMSGEVWEATLLYSQVDKEFKEDHLGEKSRFKNAKLSYYIGDFDWAQEQFKILKSATSKLISNDAIDLSVFIMDNANLDTTYAPLALYSQAELLFFQNRIDDAFGKLDSIEAIYPDHSLRDDVYFAKAQSYQKRNMFEEASLLYKKIIEEFPEDIRADNAIYALAGIKENIYGDIEGAMGLYQTLFLDYSDSTFAIDSRKKFRKLRGDNVQ